MTKTAEKPLLTFQASPLGVIAGYVIVKRFHFLSICVHSSHITAFLSSIN